METFCFVLSFAFIGVVVTKHFMPKNAEMATEQKRERFQEWMKRFYDQISDTDRPGQSLKVPQLFSHKHLPDRITIGKAFKCIGGFHVLS